MIKEIGEKCPPLIVSKGSLNERITNKVEESIDEQISYCKWSIVEVLKVWINYILKTFFWGKKTDKNGQFSVHRET